MFFFVDKIKVLRSKLPLVDLNPFTIPDRPPPTFSLFQPASIEEIKCLILSTPKSIGPFHSLPSNLLPLCIDALAPVITLSSGIFPKEFKSAVVNIYIWEQIVRLGKPSAANTKRYIQPLLVILPSRIVDFK